MTREVIDLRGLPAVEKMLDSVGDKERINRERRAVRAAGNIFKPALSAAAAARHGSGAGNVPASFKKVKVRVSTSSRRGRVPTAIVRPTSPLFNIFETGARPHRIAPKQGGAIRRSASGRHVVEGSGSGVLGGPAGSSGWTSAGRKRRGGFFARGAVQHPGMSSRALLPGVFSANVDKAEASAIAIIFGQASGSALGAAE